MKMEMSISLIGVFNKGTKEVTLPLVVGKIIGNEIRQINFEANNGGDMYKMYVDEKLKEQKYKCSCTSSRATGEHGENV